MEKWRDTHAAQAADPDAQPEGTLGPGDIRMKRRN